MNTKHIAVPVAAIAVAGVVAFVAGASGLAMRVAGMWAGVAVGGLSVAGVGALALYAIGVFEDEHNDDERRPY